MLREKATSLSSTCSSSRHNTRVPHLQHTKASDCCPCTCARLSQICSAATRDPVKGWSALLSAEAAPLPSPLPFLGKSPWATTHQVQKEEKSQPSAHFRCHHTHFSLSLPAPNFTTDGPALGPGKEAQHRVLFCTLP